MRRCKIIIGKTKPIRKINGIQILSPYIKGKRFNTEMYKRSNIRKVLNSYLVLGKELGGDGGEIIGLKRGKIPEFNPRTDEQIFKIGPFKCQVVAGIKQGNMNRRRTIGLLESEGTVPKPSFGNTDFFLKR